MKKGIGDSNKDRDARCWMISALENPHLVLMTSPLPLDFLPRNDLVCDVLAVARVEELRTELKKNGVAGQELKVTWMGRQRGVGL
jgi:hypothetical protein